jgi:hypothetical protein
MLKGMSRAVNMMLACPACEKQGEFVTWNALNATLDPHEKTRLLDRSLTQFTCADCGHQAQVVYPLLYHDVTHSYMIWMLPPVDGQSAPPEALPPEALKQLGDKYRFRLVSNLNELIEKILIFDAKLDDRIIELAKLVAGAKLPPEKADGEMYFSSLTGEGKAAMLNFAVLKPPPIGNFGFSVLNEAITGTLSTDFAAGLRQQPPGPWPRVDAAFARDMIKHTGGGGLANVSSKSDA